MNVLTLLWQESSKMRSTVSADGEAGGADGHSSSIPVANDVEGPKQSTIE